MLRRCEVVLCLGLVQFSTPAVGHAWSEGNTVRVVVWSPWQSNSQERRKEWHGKGWHRENSPTQPPAFLMIAAPFLEWQKNKTWSNGRSGGIGHRTSRTGRQAGAKREYVLSFISWRQGGCHCVLKFQPLSLATVETAVEEQVGSLFVKSGNASEATKD